MIVVSDTTALTNLLKIGQIEILRELFGEILVPPAVAAELNKGVDHAGFIDSCNWIITKKPVNELAVSILQTILDEGESEAIILAQETSADYLIIDELRGREKAKQLNIKIIGLLGILVQAKQKGIIAHVKPIMDELQKHANFFIHPSLYINVLKMAGEQ